jgi:translocation and assembly module TamB
VETPFLKAKGQGDLEKGIALSGSADLDALEKQARQFLDLGAISVAGRARFAGDLKRDEKAAEPAFNARIAIEANELRVAGLTAEPIARPSVRADFVLQGPLGESGMPTDWSRAWATIKTGGTTVQAQIAGSAASLAMSTRVEGPISEISALIGSPMDDPTAVVAAVDAAYQAGTDQLAITAARLDTAYGAIQGAGTLGEVSTRMVADLSGTVAPNFETLQQLVATQAGTPVALAGQPRAFHVRGALMADSLNTLVRQIDAEVGLDLRGASMAGMEMGPAAVVLRAANGGVGIDPIRSSLNNGQVELFPGIELRPDGSALFALGEGSAIEGAEINETLSRQLLSYIAPVLHEATQVNGKVSARFQHLAMVVAGPGAGAMSMDMAAQVQFHQVAYGPGPLAQQIMVLGGMPNAPQLVIDQPVDVTVVQGRVTQSGLAVQVAPEIQFKLDGSVGLDSTLALRAGVPLSARMLGRQEAVTEILGGTVVGVPIGGTMSRPVLDRAAFQVALRQSAGQVINRAAARGANELLKGLVGDAPLPGAASEGGTPAPGNLEDVGRGLLRQFIPGGPPRE